MGQTASSAFRKIEDVTGLPRVLLIGDSISIGYPEPVRTELKDKANVHRIPMNAATTAVGLKNLEDWLGSGHWDVIHFNFGLHDLKIMDDGQRQVPLPDYESNLRTIVQRCAKTGARLILGGDHSRAGRQGKSASSQRRRGRIQCGGEENHERRRGSDRRFVCAGESAA